MEIVGTRGQILMAKCTKIDFGWGSAPDPAGGAYDAPPDPLVGWGGGYPLPIPYRLGAYGASTLAPSALGYLTEAKAHPHFFLLAPPLMASRFQRMEHILQNRL